LLIFVSTCEINPFQKLAKLVSLEITPAENLNLDVKFKYLIDRWGSGNEITHCKAGKIKITTLVKLNLSKFRKKFMDIFSRREFGFPVSKVYKAMTDPQHLKTWWGPDGFTNTFHEFDFRVGGTWRYTMHGPEKGNYENEAVFTVIDPEKRIEWDRISNPHFYMIVEMAMLDDHRTEFSFRMRFTDEKLYKTILQFAPEKNEENFNRLEGVLREMSL